MAALASTTSSSMSPYPRMAPSRLLRASTLRPLPSELLGWGEVVTAEGVKERWAVTWFAPTIFTKEGVDIYCDRKEGLSEATYARVLEALKGSESKKVVELVETHMQPVEIRLPWVES